MSLRARAALTAAVLGAGLLTVLPSASAVDADRSAVIETRRLGSSVMGRPIYAYRVGDPDAGVTAVAMSTMHGNEAHTRQIIRAIRDGRKVRGLDLWLIPTVNPDGLARGTRKNAHGVDLNRNYPYRWADLDGNYESGSGPASEPETRAMMQFFKQVEPRYVVSFHQPLYGVDTSVRSVRRFAIRLSRGLNLPRKRFVCGGVCHGTFTQWYNHHFHGKAVTVEYDRHPSRYRMRVRAPRQLVRVLGGHY